MTCHYSFLGLSLLDTKAESANSVRISPSTLTSSAAMTSGSFSMFIDIAAEQKGPVFAAKSIYDSVEESQQCVHIYEEKVHLYLYMYYDNA